MANPEQQFTKAKFILTAAGVMASMDGKDRCVDNILIERLSRSLTYACIYSHAIETGSEARAGIGRKSPLIMPRGRIRLLVDEHPSKQIPATRERKWRRDGDRTRRRRAARLSGPPRLLKTTVCPASIALWANA